MSIVFKAAPIYTHIRKQTGALHLEMTNIIVPQDTILIYILLPIVMAMKFLYALILDEDRVK